MRDLAELHRALADETRLRILTLLVACGELCVCDVETGLDISQSRASRHMTQLRRAGLVEDRREGAWVYYRIAEPLAPPAAACLGTLREAAREDPTAQRDIASTLASRRSPCRDT
ncbi:MAG: ArsR/SmtB family transcription factor [Sandaracinaceae bacterium]